MGLGYTSTAHFVTIMYAWSPPRLRQASSLSSQDEYTVTVAGQRVTGNSYRGGSNAQENFQLPLYNRTDLPAGLHEVILTDASTRTDRLWLDLDFGIITLGDGDASCVVPAAIVTSGGPDTALFNRTKSVDTILDDTATPSITYAGDWIDTQADTSSAYYKGTMQCVYVVVNSHV